MIKDVLYNTLLFDFYSELLTHKQRDFFEMYYLNDYSLNEISKQYNITPQAVSDLIKRTERLLNAYEKKLCLLQKHKQQQDNLTILYDNIKNLSINDIEKKYILELLNKQ